MCTAKTKHVVRTVRCSCVVCCCLQALLGLGLVQASRGYGVEGLLFCCLLPLLPRPSNRHCPVAVHFVPYSTRPGKYTNLSDAYLSVIKSLQHACMEARVKLQLEWVEAANLEPETKESDPALHESRWGRPAK